MYKQQFKLIPSLSQVEWTGKKVTGSHNGTINIQQGVIETSDGNISGGRFVIDTTSIKILDITDGPANAQFAQHLASDDFFAVAQFPKAVFEISSVTGDHVEGNLTIKNITHPAGFTAEVSLKENRLIASGRIVIDRTKYGIRFRSGNFFKDLGDTLIYNDFELNISITAEAVNERASA